MIINKQQKSFTLIELERSKSVRRNESFTLIELLVVIAIIGLLSSIVLVSLKGTTGKAKITKGLEFSQSIQHALGSEAVGIWSFDDCPAGTANDASGYRNNGTIYGASCTDDTPHKVVGSSQGRYALSFDGVDDYVDCGNKASLNVTNAITVEAWVKLNSDPNCDGGNNWRYLLHKGGADGWGVWNVILEEDRRFTWSISTVGGSLRYYGHGNALSISDWTHLVFTHVSGQAKIYFNGKEIPGAYWATGSGNINTNALSFRINHPSVACPSGAGNFPGTIDEVRIYSEALSSAEIQKLYAEGLEKYKNLAKE